MTGATLLDQSAWLTRGLTAGSLVSLACAPLGVALYYRRESLMADALAHTALPGIAAGAIIAGAVTPLALFGGAVGAGLVAAGAIALLASLPGVRRDAAIGAVFTTMFAAGVLLLSTRLRGVHLDPQCALFGDLLAVGDGSITALAVAVATVWLAVAGGWRVLEASCVDPGWMSTLGVDDRWVRAAVLGLTSLVVVSAFEAVGAVLVVAVVVVPAATAALVARSLSGAMAIALAVSLVALTVGFAMAVALDVSPTGAVVTALGVVFAATLRWTRGPTQSSAASAAYSSSLR
ncbi:MAG: metal ABC transporter permease [Myxococcales bacterium]|nr:metal ABC transporter permease [Myxococcales bacterium]MCB9520037.1 metal ABC transporter permease [Myxococcales bacterium]